MNGAATNPDFNVVTYAATQVKNAIDATIALGGTNYVFWGGREGYMSLLNTDMKRETVYVKDNDTWEKENQEKKKLKWAINSIAQLNLNQVQQWQQEYPECIENNTKANTKFTEMACNKFNPQFNCSFLEFDYQIQQKFPTHKC